MSNVAVIQQPKREAIQVFDPIPILDTARFEHMQRIATVMARSNLIPESLCKEGKGDDKVFLPENVVIANCFLVVNQAVRWNMDPFAVAQSVSVVHGKLCYEGKLIAAVIEERLGIRLKYRWDDKQGDNLGIVVSGKYPDEDEERTIEGTVREWKTTGTNSPWGKQPKKQLAYRGAREWARLHAPAVMLGVYTPDDFDDLSSSSRSVAARDMTPPIPPVPPSAPVIEHKPAIPAAPVETRQPIEATTAPPVPPAPPEPRAEAPKPHPRIQEAADRYASDNLLERFKRRASLCQDLDELNTAWIELVEPHENELFPPDLEDLSREFRMRKAEIEP